MTHVPKIREFIIDNFLYGEEGSLTEETSFLGNNIIDSTGVLELVDFLEGTFNVRIGDDEIIPDNLDTLKKIDRYLEIKLNGSRI
jgi:acyl carrier protein